jgi:starch-binding outer membrane protein, SusD/RagB family
VLDDIGPSAYTNTGRAAIAQVYAQIEKDLTEAINVLPVKSTLAGANRFRVSKGTAQALLGKAYLFQQKWNEASVQLENVITSGQYGLEPSIGKVFSQAGEFGQESVFEISYTNARSYDWGNFPWGSAPESNIHIQLMGPRGEFYTKAPADSLIAGWGFNLPRKKLYDAYIAAGDVNRRRETVMSEAELIAAGGNWTNPTAHDYAGYFQRKYGSFQSRTGSPIGELNYGTNWRHVRYSDVLLMAAEAFHKAGNDTKGRGYLNQVRVRAGLPVTSVSGNALFEAIVTERMLELAFEGVRFVDLVRWGRAQQEMGTLGFIAGKHELLPIPDYEVKTGTLKQNPNY